MKLLYETIKNYDVGATILLVLILFIRQINFVVVGNKFVINLRKGKSKIVILLNKNKRLIFSKKNKEQK